MRNEAEKPSQYDVAHHRHNILCHCSYLVLYVCCDKKCTSVYDYASVSFCGGIFLMLAFAFGKKTHKEMCRMTGQNPVDTMEDERTDLLLGKSGFFTWIVQMAVLNVCLWIAFALRIGGIITSFAVPVLITFITTLHGLVFLLSYVYYQKRN